MPKYDEVIVMPTEGGPRGLSMAKEPLPVDPHDEMLMEFHEAVVLKAVSQEEESKKTEETLQVLFACEKILSKQHETEKKQADEASEKAEDAEEKTPGRDEGVAEEKAPEKVATIGPSAPAFKNLEPDEFRKLREKRMEKANEDAEKENKNLSPEERAEIEKNVDRIARLIVQRAVDNLKINLNPDQMERAVSQFKDEYKLYAYRQKSAQQAPDFSQVEAIAKLSVLSASGRLFEAENNLARRQQEARDNTVLDPNPEAKEAEKGKAKKKVKPESALDRLAKQFEEAGLALFGATPSGKSRVLGDNKVSVEGNRFAATEFNNQPGSATGLGRTHLSWSQYDTIGLRQIESELASKKLGMQADLERGVEKVVGFNPVAEIQASQTLSAAQTPRPTR